MELRLRGKLRPSAQRTGNPRKTAGPHALAEDCTLTSADRAFTKVPGLRVLDWSAPLNPPD